MKKTFKQLREFNLYAQFLMERKPEIKETKFGYAMKRFVDKNLTKPFNDFNADLDIVRIDHALVDEKTKAILHSEKGSLRPFQYSKEGLKAVIKGENDLIEQFNLKEFECEPFISKEKPELTEEEIEAFKGLII